jgi:hypothetical protein
VENQLLQAENNIRLDQLTFGERVDSPNATKLPVMLAVALLRDNEGRIDVNLPISGSLSDPQFSVGGLVGKVLVNLITKAVTSPFRLLGALFGGGGEELAYTEFVPGQAVLSPEVTAKLDNLGKALKSRSGLKLDITGRVDPASDTEGLKRVQLESRLKHLKMADMHGHGRGVDEDSVSLDAAERERYLQQAYSAEKMDKPRNVIGLAKTLPGAQAEQLLLGNIKIGEDSLRALAQARADKVYAYLETTVGIPRERMFLVAPRLDAEGIKDKGAPNRVDFALK